MANQIKQLLLGLKICQPGSIYKFYPRVRDKIKNLTVLRCKKSGVIFLSRTDHIDSKYYNQINKFKYWSAKNRSDALKATLEDDRRRSREFKKIIAGKRWLDLGTGAGGILDFLSPLAGETYAVEPQAAALNILNKIGYKVYADLTEVQAKNLDVITVFHVFEHLSDPLSVLREIKNRLKIGGKVIIEVPHARDFLFNTLDLDSFKDFTFWSEHLILHTKQSLKKFLEAAGFKRIKISGYQRYPLSNHLYWLRYGKPAGHKKWDFLNGKEIEKAYADLLKKIDQTDTLIAVAEK